MVGLGKRSCQVAVAWGVSRGVWGLQSWSGGRACSRGEGELGQDSYLCEFRLACLSPARLGWSWSEPLLRSGEGEAASLLRGGTQAALAGTGRELLSQCHTNASAVQLHQLCWDHTSHQLANGAVGSSPRSVPGAQSATGAGDVPSRCTEQGWDRALCRGHALEGHRALPSGSGLHTPLWTHCDCVRHLDVSDRGEDPGLGSHEISALGMPMLLGGTSDHVQTAWTLTQSIGTGTVSCTRSGRWLASWQRCLRPGTHSWCKA